MNNKKFILLGSDKIAIPAFKKIIKKHQVVAIITKPDAKSGRGMKFKETAVAKLAKDHKIKLWKPQNLIHFIPEIKKTSFDILLSFAYGKYIPKEMLSLSKLPPLNIHGSLLPKYRGPAPIENAILNNEKEIGISLIEMEEALDAGKIFFQSRQSIAFGTSAQEGYEIISKLASDNILEWIEKLIKTKFNVFKIQGKDFSFAPKIKKSFCEINFKNKFADEYLKINACNSKPGAYFYQSGKRIKIFKVSINHNIKSPLKLQFKDKSVSAIEYQYPSKKKVVIK